MLNPVDISDFSWSCAVYCMRRVGYRRSLESFLSEVTEPLKDAEKLVAGDILVWNIEPWKDASPRRIENPGIPISYAYTIDRHFAVYEGDNRFSDIYYVTYGAHCAIRICNLTEHSWPDGVIYREKTLDDAS